MTSFQFAQFVRAKTHTNTITFTDNQMLAFMAIRNDYLASRVLEADEDYFGAPETTDLVNGRREYPLPADMLNRVKAVEFSPDGGTTWIRMLPFDLSVYNRTTDENAIQNNFSNVQDSAFYDIYRGSLWLYTGVLSDFTPGNNCLKIWTYEWPTPPSSLTDNTNDMSIPINPTEAKLPRNLHYSWALLTIIDYKESFDKPISLSQQELSVQTEINRALAQIVPIATEDSPVGALPDKNHQWDDGFNL